MLMCNIKALILIYSEVFKKIGQGNRVKNNGTHGKVLSHEILIWIIKALALSVQKLLARLNSERGGQNDRFTQWQTGQKQCAPDLQTGRHKNQINVNHFVCY